MSTSEVQTGGVRVEGCDRSVVTILMAQGLGRFGARGLGLGTWSIDEGHVVGIHSLSLLCVQGEGMNYRAFCSPAT